MKVFLGLGVLGGAALALLAGLATARRAMSPITELTEAAREIQRTRDPSLRVPHPEAEDEVAELARTLEGMLRSLDAARGETQAALERQREFVADASHELRTPLTSVLANLELLEDELEGEQREAAASALRSSRRMRRLVADLLLLARADAGRLRAHDAARPRRGASSRRRPSSSRWPSDHALAVSAPRRRDRLRRARRAAPPRAEPDGERAAPHRPGDRGARDDRARRRAGRAGRRGRRTGHPAGAAREGLRALLPRRRREQRVDVASASRSCARSPPRTAAASRSSEPLDGRGARFVVRLPGLPAGEATGSR